MEFYVTRNDELYHWGIKGMRWGVRRYQNRDGSLTPLGKQHLAERNIRTEENLVEKTIPKGTKMYRVTATKNDGRSGKSAYVTYLDADRNLYRSGTTIKGYESAKLGNDEWLKRINDGTYDNSVYEHTYELKSDIKIPSLKHQREIQQKVMKNKKYQLEVGEEYCKQLLAHEGMDVKHISIISKMAKTINDKPPRDAYLALAKKYGEDDAVYYYHEAKSYNDSKKYVDSLDSVTIERSLGTAMGVKEAIISELKKQGYTAMYDNASIGVESNGRYNKLQEGVEPLIIFDGDKSLKEIGNAKVDVAEQERSQQAYAEWRNGVDNTLRKFQ